MHLGLQRHGGHLVWFQSFTQKQLSGFGPHTYDRRAQAHQAHPSRTGHQGIHLSHQDIAGRGGVRGEQRLQAGRHVAVVMAAPQRGGAGHGVEDGVAERGWLFVAGSTLGDGGLVCCEGGGLRQARRLQLTERREGGASRQQSGGGGEWSGRSWRSRAGTGSSLRPRHQSQAVDQVQLLHQRLGQGGGQAAGGVPPQQRLIGQAVVVFLSGGDGGEAPAHGAGVGAGAWPEAGPHVGVVQTAAGRGAAAVDPPLRKLLGRVGTVCAGCTRGTITLQWAPGPAQGGGARLLLGLLGPHATLQQLAAVVHGRRPAARSFSRLPSLRVEHPPGTFTRRFVVDPQELVVE